MVHLHIRQKAEAQFLNEFEPQVQLSPIASQFTQAAPGSFPSSALPATQATTQIHTQAPQVSTQVRQSPVISQAQQHVASTHAAQNLTHCSGPYSAPQAYASQSQVHTALETIRTPQKRGARAVPEFTTQSAPAGSAPVHTQSLVPSQVQSQGTHVPATPSRAPRSWPGTPVKGAGQATLQQSTQLQSQGVHAPAAQLSAQRSWPGTPVKGSEHATQQQNTQHRTAPAVVTQPAVPGPSQSRHPMKSHSQPQLQHTTAWQGSKMAVNSVHPASATTGSLSMYQQQQQQKQHISMQQNVHASRTQPHLQRSNSATDLATCKYNNDLSAARHSCHSADMKHSGAVSQTHRSHSAGLHMNALAAVPLPHGWQRSSVTSKEAQHSTHSSPHKQPSSFNGHPQHMQQNLLPQKHARSNASIGVDAYTQSKVARLPEAAMHASSAGVPQQVECQVPGAPVQAHSALTNTASSAPYSSCTPLATRNRNVL